MLRCVRELRLSHRFLSLWNVRRLRLSSHKPRNLVRILRPSRLHLRICPIPPHRLSTLLARAGAAVQHYWLLEVLWLCQHSDKGRSKLKTLDDEHIYQSQIYAAYIKPVIFYHSSHAASGHPLASNATQPSSPLLSEVDSGRGAGWEMRRCKRKRRRIRPGILGLWERSCYQRLCRKVRRPWTSRSLGRIGADATRLPARSHFTKPPIDRQVCSHPSQTHSRYPPPVHPLS